MDDKGEFSFILSSSSNTYLRKCEELQVEFMEFYHLFRPSGWDEKEEGGRGSWHGPDLTDLVWRGSLWGSPY